MAVWPLTSSLSIERDFKIAQKLILIIEAKTTVAFIYHITTRALNKIFFLLPEFADRTIPLNMSENGTKISKQS